VYGTGLRPLAFVSAAVLAVAFAMVFFYAPLDADQGFIQKVFYLHVPMALVALGGFIAGGVFAFRHLRSGDRRWDMRSYVAVHLSIILAIGTLVTGSIWARASWGHWWVWSEPILVAFLIITLLYCCYQPLRFSIEDRDRQARYASVFSITAAVFVPVCFVAVRLAESFTHPKVFAQTGGGGMPAPMFVTFLVCLAAFVLLFVTLWKLELSAKGAAEQLGRLRARLERERDDAPPPRERPPAAVPAGG
jgi:heme exporter protein C